jgi:hypothetical protein
MNLHNRLVKLELRPRSCGPRVRVARRRYKAESRKSKYVLVPEWKADQRVLIIPDRDIRLLGRPLPEHFYRRDMKPGEDVINIPDAPKKKEEHCAKRRVRHRRGPASSNGNGQVRGHDAET